MRNKRFIVHNKAMMDSTGLTRISKVGDSGASQINPAYTADESDVEEEQLGLHQYARSGNVEVLSQLLANRRIQVHVNDLEKNGMSPLHYAARYNHLEAAKLLVSKGRAFAGVSDTDGATPLHYCARKQQKDAGGKDVQTTVDLIQMLVFLTDVNVRDNYGSSPLHFAAMRGNVVATKALLDSPGVNVDIRDNLGCTPLHETATYNQLEVAKLLVAAGADPQARDNQRRIPLHYGCMGEENTKFVRWLADRTDKAKQEHYLNLSDTDQNTPLHMAIDARNMGAVRTLLKRGANVHAVCRHSSTSSSPLHLAAVAGEKTVLKLLLEHGARTWARNADMSTPLHKAVEYQNEEAVKILLQAHKGLEALEKRDREFYTPLLMSACYSSSTIQQALLGVGADVMAVEQRERTPLHMAAECNQLENVKVIVQFARKVGLSTLLNCEDQTRETALHIAASKGYVDIVEYLLLYDGDMTALNEDEETPFLLAAKNGQLEVVELFIKKSSGKVLNDQDEFSNTCLHVSCESGHLDVVRVLVETGADKEARNDRNRTPLDLASCHGHVSVIKYLIDEDVSPNPADKDKMHPLLLAAINGHDDTVSALIERGADMSATDTYNRNCLDIAMEKGHREVVNAIVDSSQWQAAFLHERESTLGPRTTPMRMLIRKYPDIALRVFDKCIYKSPEEIREGDFDYYFQFDFMFLDDTYFDYDKDTCTEMAANGQEQYDKNHLYGNNFPYSQDSVILKQNHPLNIIVDKKRDALLAHPLILSLARHKWNVIRPLYFSFLIYFCLYLGLFTAYMLSATPPYLYSQADIDVCRNSTQMNKPELEQNVSYVIWVLAVIGIIIEITQMVFEKWIYLQLTNVIDWFAYISAIYVLADDNGNCHVRTPEQWQLGAACLFVSWVNLLLFTRRLPALGIYVVMITEILQTFAKFFVAFFLFIVAFGLTFYVLVQNQEPFSTPGESIVKTWVMMLGEMEYTSLFFDGSAPAHYSGVTYVLFIMFMIVLAIVLTNLLVGLAVDDVNQLQAHAKLRKVAMQIELALDIEFSLPKSLRRYFLFSICRKTVYPNRPKSLLTDMMNNVMDGPILRWEKICQSVKSLEGEPSEIENLEQKMSKLVKVNQAQMRNMNQRLDRLDAMLISLVEQQGVEPRRIPRRPVEVEIYQQAGVLHAAAPPSGTDQQSEDGIDNDETTI